MTTTLLTLFLSALVSATVFPGQSEAVLAGFIAHGGEPWLLVGVASAGNTLGSVLNWVLGRGIGHLTAKMERARSWYQRYGKWSLLLSWAPVVGDALTVAAGVMREPLWIFVLLVAIAKTLRYVVVALVALQLIA